jgi:phosphoglycolate phosphatase
MKNIDLFIFDLDGTLIDSKRDIADSVHYTFKKLGLPPVDDATIYKFVGNGVTPLIEKTVLAAGGHSFKNVLEEFRVRYNEHLLDTTQLFPGIEKVLDHFSDKPKVIVTNKSQGYSEKIIKGLGLENRFKGLFGGDTSFPKKPEPDVIHHILEKFKADPQKTVIVGDSPVDLKTGHNSGILTCGVTWGFCPLEELKKIGCDHLIESPEELIRLFC